MKVAKRLELGVTFKSPLRVAVKADLSYKRIENLINAKKPKFMYINPVLFNGWHWTAIEGPTDKELMATGNKTVT